MERHLGQKFLVLSIEIDKPQGTTYMGRQGFLTIIVQVIRSFL